MDFDDPKKAMCCCCSLTSIVALAILGFFSYATLDAQELGLDYSSITKTITPMTYTSGYHILGFGHSFIKYPSTVQTMEFSSERTANRPPILSRTEDGLEISFKAVIQFQLQSSNLYKLYMKYGENYRSPCEKHAIETLNDAATRYNANSFFQSTDTINTMMKNDLQRVLSRECFCDIWVFQISGIDLPNKFETAIQDTQIKDNDINTALAEQNNIAIALNTTIANATNTMDVVINQARAKAQSDIAGNDAQMSSWQVNIQNQASSYAGLKSNLAMTNAQLLTYIKSQVISEFQQSSLVVTIPSRSQ